MKRPEITFSVCVIPIIISRKCECVLRLKAKFFVLGLSPT